MHEDLLLFLALLWHDWWARMSSAVFTFLAIYAAFASKSNQWIVASSAVVGVLLFLIGTFAVWREEHAKRTDTEKKLPAQLPDFDLRLGQTYWVYQPETDVTALFIFAEVTNRGADSAGLYWRGQYKSDTLDVELGARNLATSEVRIPMGEGKVRVITQSELIHTRTLPTVQRGHNVSGRVLLVVDGDRRAEIEAGGVILTVICADYTGRKYTAEYKPSGRGRLFYGATEKVVDESLPR